jgi:hypothetical protein
MDESVIIALFMDEKMAFQFSLGMVMASNHGRFPHGKEVLIKCVQSGRGFRV